MGQPSITRGLIEVMLDGDQDDRRFEKFTADLFSLRDRVQYETTAPTGDTGVDAEGRSVLIGGVAVVCATTQSGGYRAKANSDVLKQVARSRHIVRLHICFSKDVAKETLDLIQQDAITLLPSAEVEAHGQSGLCDLAFRYPQAFSDCYSRELDEHTLWLKGKTDEEDDDNQINILRVALTTVFAPEMSAQREAVLDTLIITALADGKAKSCDHINAAVAAGLKLVRSPMTSYLVSTLESLRQRGLIAESRGGFRLTDAGHDFRDRLIANGARSSLDGRAAFRSLLSDLPEGSLSDGEFSKLWKTVQRRLSRLFIVNGLRIIGELQSMLQADETASTAGPATGVLSKAVQGLLDDIQMLRLNPIAAGKIAEVLGEMLRNRHSRPFLWISELAVKYIVICALGLDPELERRVRDRMSTWVIAPDTHVILSYLCRGDEGHFACDAVLKQLHRFDCQIWAMQPVVEEAVHHAEISSQSFDDWWERVRSTHVDFPDVHPADLLQAADNAFVKGFAAEVGRSFKRSEWQEYIQQFRGLKHLDLRPLSRILNEELRAQRIDDDEAIRAVGRAYAAKLLNSDEKPVNATATMRCEWDGRLLASCVVRRQSLPTNRRLILVSDSDRLRVSMYRMIAPDRRFGIKIVDPAALAYSLAFTPGTWVNLDCVRHFLFSGTVNLPEYVLAESLLVERFLQAPRFLRTTAIYDRMDDAVVPERDPRTT